MRIITSPKKSSALPSIRTLRLNPIIDSVHDIIRREDCNLVDDFSFMKGSGKLRSSSFRTLRSFFESKLSSIELVVLLITKFTRWLDIYDSLLIKKRETMQLASFYTMDHNLHRFSIMLTWLQLVFLQQQPSPSFSSFHYFRLAEDRKNVNHSLWLDN